MPTNTTRQNTTVIAPSNIVGSGTTRQIIATILSDGQTHTVSSVLRRSGASWDGFRGRISELRTRNGFVIDHSNGFVTLRGIQV